MSKHHATFHDRVTIAIAAIGLTITVFAYAFVSHSVNEKKELQLTNLASEAKDQLITSVNVITYGLSGANGVFAASQSVERHEFREYVKSRNLPLEFPGVYGFAFAEYVKRENLEDFIERAKADEKPDYTLKTSGSEPDLMPVKFIEPEAENLPALGFDIGSDRIRRVAALKALTTGKPTLSKKVHLLQAEGNHAGFLYIKPVFKKNYPLNSPEERKEAIYGFVFAPFTLEKIVEPLLKKWSEPLSISVYEGEEISTESLVYSNISDSVLPGTERILPVMLGQQPWVIKFQANTAFFNQNGSEYLPAAVVIFGCLTTLFAAIFAWIYLEEKKRNFDSKLREGEQFVQGILDSANFSIIVTEPNGIIRVFNQAASRMLGYAPEEVIGKVSPAIIHDPKEVAVRAEEISKKLQRKVDPGFEVFIAEISGNQAVEKEWTYIRKDGSKFPVILSATAMRDDEGKVVAYMGIANDISVRKRAEKELRKSEERFRTSFDSASHGIALVGLDGRWLKVNRALCQIVGRSERELLTLTFQDITHPDDLGADLESVRKTLAGQIKSYDMEKRYIRANSGFIWVLQSVSLVRDEDGTPLHFVSQIQDINDRKYAEVRLKESTEESIQAKLAAENAAQSKSQFLANMSHEIRTPLTSIIGYSESLQADNLDEQEKKIALQTVIRNGNHLLGVINDILDLSKIEAGKTDIEIGPVTLSDLLSDVSNLILPKANEKALSFGFNYNFPIPRKIYTDSIRLKQILINLVGNAVKFTSVGGVKVNVDYDRETKLLKFAVIDTGPGLTVEQRGKLFQAFSQADTSITRRFGGTGLGLVISHQLAKRLGGDISLESEPGKGSVFTVSISVGDIKEEDLTDSFPKYSSVVDSMKAVDEIPKLNGQVLVVEDGEDNRGLISFLLKKTGVKYTMVENGLLGVEEANKSKFDLILMDVQMPVMDGYTATQQIRQKGLEVPIVALTANAMKSDVEKALSSGCTDFLGKPFTRTELYAILTKYLNGGTSKPASNIKPEERTIALIKEDPEIVELILSIIHNLPTRLQEIELATENDDWTKTSLLAHTLRGASGNIGLMMISEEAGMIERAAKAGEVDLVRSQVKRLKYLIEDAQKLDDALKAIN